MNEQFTGKQHEHGQYAIVYDGTRTHKEKEQFGFSKCSIVKDKEQKKIEDIIDICIDNISQFKNLSLSAICSIQHAANIDEMFAMNAGLIPHTAREGLIICPACLQGAIITCEDVTNILKNLQVAIKEYLE